MPASSTLAAPYGRVTSGRGFAPTGAEAYDLPAAGHFTRDLSEISGKASTEAWLRQAKMSKGLSGMHKRTHPNQITSGMQGMGAFSAADDAGLQQAAKRPRLMLPDYGRSASEPLLSFLRQKARDMNIAVETLQLAADAAKPSPAELPKALRSFQSGPARVVDGKPSPNYRIYSNAFQGIGAPEEGRTPNYSHAKVASVSSVSLAPVKAATAPAQPLRSDPTPHPSFLKQPLPTRRPDQDAVPLRLQGSSQQVVSQRLEQPLASESGRDKATEAAQKPHAEGPARLQLLHRGGAGVHPRSTSPTQQSGSNPLAQLASSPKPSASHSTLSGEDTEEASCASHGLPAAQGLSPRAAVSSPEATAREGQAGTELSSGGRPTAPAACPMAGTRDSASPSPCPRDEREGDRKRKSLDSRGSKDSSRKPPSPKTDVSSSKGHSTAKAAARPWGTLSSALQPVSAPGGVQDAYPPTQLMADALKKPNGMRQEVEGNLQQLLQELTYAQGRAHAQNAVGMQRMDPQQHPLAGHANPPRAPLPAQLQCPAAVMQNSFNRLSHAEAKQAGFTRASRPEAEQGGYPQAHPSSFPPSGPSPYGQEHHRGFPVSSRDFGAKFPQQSSAPISSAALSCLPPSVAAFYESEQRQHQHQQRQMTGQGSASNHHLNGLNYNHLQQMSRQLAQQQMAASAPDAKAHYNEGPSGGFAHSAHPMAGKGYLGSESGFRIPSRVVTGMDAGGVRNPALLDRPVMSSHRDPQAGPPMNQDPRYLNRGGGSRQQVSAQALEQYNQDLAMHAARQAQHAQHAQHDAVQGPRGSSYFSGASSQQNSQQNPLHALGDMLGNSNLSPADMAQLCSFASSGYAGNLNQLITQLQLVNELAHAQHDPAQPLVETTHRVVIPAAHLKEGSHAIARQTAAPLANMRVQSSMRPMVSDGGNRVGQPSQGRAVDAPARRETQSALDVVAEAAAAEAAAEAADDEPSELLMLAAETLAGLNNMQPRVAAADPRPAPSNQDAPGNDSPAAARKLSRQLGDANRKQKRKQAQGPKPATAVNVTTAAAVHADGGGASVHPILGFSVPHSRRSYHRDSIAAPARNRSSASAAEATEVRSGSGDQKSNAAAMSTGNQKKAVAVVRPSAARSDMLRAASDSSMTVSADSTQGGDAQSGSR